MIILFGTKVRYTTLASGQFYCPQCKARRDYELRKARHWFTLYFVPLVPLNTIGEFVTCLTCGVNFQKDVLSTPMPAATPLDRFAQEARADMDSGTPIEFVRQKLINTGLKVELADQITAAAAGPERRRCPADGLTYRPRAIYCAKCGAALENLPQG